MSASRQWNVPDNLHALAAHAKNGYADELDSISIEDAQQAFVEAESVCRRLGGRVGIASLRAKRSDGWITLGYSFVYQSFEKSIGPEQQKDEVPEHDPDIVEPDPETVEA